MSLNTREKIIALVSSAIAIYSAKLDRGSLPKNVTMYDFILKAMPEELKSELSMQTIDEVFDYVSTTHSS